MTSSQLPTLGVRIERWPIAGSFTISRGAKTEAVTVVAEVSHGGHTGRGECVPYPRYGETPEATLAALEAMQEPLSQGLDRMALQAAMPAGAARNALDCALLDLEAKSSSRRAWALLGRPAPRPATTAFTISLGTPEAMAAAAANDDALARIKRPVAVCADESVHERASLKGLRERYDAVNIKLDKTGGVTEALAMADAAHALGFEIMIGCMVATSLSMAPAMLLAQQARFVDLDGPLLLAKDRDDGLRYEGSLVYPPEAALWG